jgi:hypothetical protein
MHDLDEVHGQAGRSGIGLYWIDPRPHCSQWRPAATANIHQHSRNPLIASSRRQRGYCIDWCGVFRNGVSYWTSSVFGPQYSFIPSFFEIKESARREFLSKRIGGAFFEA